MTTKDRKAKIRTKAKTESMLMTTELANHDFSTFGNTIIIYKYIYIYIYSALYLSDIYFAGK